MQASQLPRKAAYVTAWRRLKALPADATIKHPDWTRGNVTAAEMLAEMRGALDRRINERGGDHEANQPIPVGYIRDARRLDDIRGRVRVYQFETQECRELFGDRLANHND